MRRAAVLLFLLLCFAAPARAIDSLSLEYGRGNDRTDLWRIGAQWQWDKRWWQRGGWHLGAYWDLQLGEWRNGRDVYDLSITPVFRYQRSSGDVIPYVEAAIGFHLLSDVSISRQRIFSTRFQYGDHVGVGAVIGRHDLSVRLQHLSNGGIARPNPGINFLVLRYQLRLD